MNTNKAEFIRSASGEQDFLRDGLPQVVFAGRSNVGKSSVINRLVGRKNLAFVGATPGKTAHINYFLVDKRFYFVDLPGYGYAKVSEAEKRRWARLMESYFAMEGLIRLGILIVDARHNPTEGDCIMANFFMETACPFVVVANKIDKLKKSEVAPNLIRIAETLELSPQVSVVPFSAERGTGKSELLSLIEATI